METPVAVTIAGSDNSGGAGIQADLKTFTHFKVYAQTVITCVVAEVPGKVCSIQAIEPEVVRDQLNLESDLFPGRGDQDRDVVHAAKSSTWSVKSSRHYPGTNGLSSLSILSW